MDQDYLYAASNQETTGLTPTVAHDEFEAESYQELNHYLPPVMTTESSQTKHTDGTSDDLHLRAADGIHAEMRMEVQPQKNFKRDK